MTRRPRRTFRRCPAESPACRCRSTTPRSSARTSSGRALPAGGTRATSPSPPRGSSWRSERAAPTRVCGTRRPACPTARAASRRVRAHRACGRWRRRPPTSAPRGRSRRRRRGPRDARRHRDRGCSSTCAWRLRRPRFCGAHVATGGADLSSHDGAPSEVVEAGEAAHTDARTRVQHARSGRENQRGDRFDVG